MSEYDLNEFEQKELALAKEQLATHRTLVRADVFGQPVADQNGELIREPHRVTRSRRYLIDAKGRAWRYAARGAQKETDPGAAIGVPRRNNAVEMWSGKWVQTGDGSWIPRLIWVPIDKHISGHAAAKMGPIEWYTTAKGYRHPLDAPAAPPQRMQKVLAANAEADATHVMEQAAKVGYEAAKAQVLQDAPKPRRRRKVSEDAA